LSKGRFEIAMRDRNPCDSCVFCTGCDIVARIIQNYCTIYGTVFRNTAITLKAPDE